MSFKTHLESGSIRSVLCQQNVKEKKKEKEDKGILHNSFNKVNIFLIPKPSTLQENKTTDQYPSQHRCENS